MSIETHYEIFRWLGKGGWVLHEVVYERDLALKIAQAQRAGSDAPAVKVIKEAYNNETGDYLTLKIFEDGLASVKTEPAAEDVPYAVPCFKPDDLYAYHARATLARLLVDFLSSRKITVTELIHRADMLEAFEATGTLYQHAVQKIAVAQASSTKLPVQQIVRSLNDLATKAIQRVGRDERRAYFPDVEAGQFGALAAKLAVQPDGAYVFNGAIARHLRDANGWDEKVFRLVAVLEQAPGDGPARTLIFASVDAIIAEILGSSMALRELVRGGEHAGAMLTSLVQLFLGKEPERPASNHAGLLALTQSFAADKLPAARTAIANRIVAEIKSVKRLCPASLVDELTTLRRIASRLVPGVGKYMGHEDLIAAFTLRSKRLVTHEALSGHLADAATPDEKVERILFVEENVIGLGNKRQLSAFLLPIITAAPFENHFLNAAIPLPSRLERLASLQSRVRRSSMQENQRDAIAAALDKVAFDAEARGKLLEAIESRATGPVDKAVSILQLCTNGTFTEGRLAARARKLVMRHVSKPGFLAGYAAHLATATGASMPTAEAARAELMETLGKAGINAENGLRSAAA